MGLGGGAGFNGCVSHCSVGAERVGTMPQL